MSNVMSKIVDMERRLARQESNRGTSLRFCEVTEVDSTGKARVRLLDGDGMISHPLRTLQLRTLKDKHQHLPEVGEQVAVLFAGQGMEQGVILGAVYSEKHPSREQEIHMAYYEFEDGTTLSYDKKKHLLLADVKGDAELHATGNVDATVGGNVTADVAGNVSATVGGDLTAEAAGQIEATAGQMLNLTGAAGVYIYGPTIAFRKLKGGGSCKAVIEADIEHIGQMEHQGDTVQNGSQTTNGSITASGAITGNPVHGCPNEGGD